MSAARRRRKAHRQAAFWAEREAQQSGTGTLTVTLAADADRFRQAMDPFATAQRDLERQIREINQRAMHLMDRHVDEALAELDASRTPAAFTREDRP